MKPTIPLLVVGLNLATFGGWSGVRAHAAEESKDLTRVAIAISGGPVAYTDQLRENPPAIVIEFRSRNVRAQLEPLVAVNSGLIKEIQSDYYPPGRRALKSLTLTLIQPAAYTIAQQANQIVVDIETPASVLPGRMAVGRGVTVLGIEAKETLIQRLKVMEGALRQAGPTTSPVASMPKPVVVTKPVEIPQPIVQPTPAPTPVSRKGRGGFWYGLLVGIAGSLIGLAGWRRWRRKAVVSPRGPAEVVPMAQSASVYEQLILKAAQRQGQKLISSKAIEGLGAIWIVEKDGARHGVLCLTNGEFFERKVLEQFLDALKQETLPSGTVMALGAFTAPAQAFAKECGIALVAREEVLRMINAELKGPVLEPEAAAGLARLEGELAQARERIGHLEQELSTHAEFKGKVKTELEAWEKEVETLKKKSLESEWYLGEERAKRQALEQQVAELTKQLAAKDELYTKLTQEADQLKAKSAEVDERLAAEQEKRTQLETQIAQLEEQLKGQASTVADLPAAPAAQAGKAQRIQALTEAAKDTLKVVAVEEAKAPQGILQGQERRQGPRLDLSRHKGKGVLVRATSNDGEPMNGDARNISAGGLCVELPSGALADLPAAPSTGGPTGAAQAGEFELKLFLPDRTKPIEAIGKLIWKGRGNRRLPAPRSSRQAGRMEQLGIAFSAVNAPDQEAISHFIEEASLKPVSVG